MTRDLMSFVHETINKVRPWLHTPNEASKE